MKRTLVELLVPHLCPALRDQADAAGPALELALGQLARRARQTLRGAPELDPGQLLAYVAERLPAQGELLGSLERLCVEDLALAMACAGGNTEAIVQLERQHFGVVDAALARMPDAASQVQEIKQQLRQRLFVRVGDQPPRIAQYSGLNNKSQIFRDRIAKAFTNDLAWILNREFNLTFLVPFRTRLQFPFPDPFCVIFINIFYLKIMFNIEFFQSGPD